RWLIDKRNPLPWRSIVNRVWLWHFDTGIIDTPNDFGKMGSLPSHPELLDWLASEFRDTGGSFKKLHRLILTSKTYRQSSISNPALNTPKRNVTITALQTLSLMNNRFVLRQCEHIAARLLQESGDLKQQIECAYQLFYGRSPTTEESELIGGYARKHGLAHAC